MSLLPFKQSTAKRVVETKSHARAAVGKKRRKPLLFHNGTSEKPVMIFRANSPKAGYLTQADIDALPADHVPTYTNQLYGKIIRGELKPFRFFWKKAR